MILVTGGSGFIGRHLIAALALQGRKVRVLSRSPERALQDTAEPIRVAEGVMERMAELGHIDAATLRGARDRAQSGERAMQEAVATFQGDIRDADSLRAAVEGTEAVVHTVAIIRETQGRTFQDTNVEATKRIIAAMHQTGGRRLIAMGILGAIDDPRLPYAQSRWRAEQAITTSGLDYTVVKPSLVLGVADTVSVRLLRLLDFLPPVVPLPDGGRARFQPLWVGDLIMILLLCLRDQRTSGQSYELGGPEYVTFSGLARQFAKVTGKRRIFVPVPSALMMPAAAAMGRVFKDPPATPTELRQLKVDNTTSLDAAPRHFGFVPKRLDEYIGYVETIAHPQPYERAR